MRNSDFFNELSVDYDVMINFNNSLNNKIESLRKFINPEDKNALDLGCGSGVDSIVLSKFGLTVDAVDHSAGMLDQAVKNAGEFGAKINFIKSNLCEFSVKNKKYDIIVSLGNTIANLNQDELHILLNNLNGFLNTNGRIIIQLINYAKLPQSGTHLLKKFENDSITIIRKYKIGSDKIHFIIDKTDKKTNNQSSIITILYPHIEKDFIKLANEMNFNIAFYGNLKKASYIQDKSENLVVVLSK